MCLQHRVFKTLQTRYRIFGQLRNLLNLFFFFILIYLDEVHTAANFCFYVCHISYQLYIDLYKQTVYKVLCYI